MDFSSIFEEAVARTSISEIVSRCDTILDLAERTLNKRLKGASKSIVVISIVTDASGDYTLPSDFNGVKSVYNGISKLHNSTDQYIKSYKGQSGYSVVGNKIKTSVPNSTLELTYYANLPNLKTNSSNWLSEDDPELYINAIMFHGILFKAMLENDANKLNILNLKGTNLKVYLDQLINEFLNDDTVNSYQSMSVNVGAPQ